MDVNLGKLINEYADARLQHDIDKITAAADALEQHILCELGLTVKVERKT